jgi:anti-anti-sigma regulatory factor
MADALKVLSYEGSLGIEQASSLQSAWRFLLESGHSLIINLSRVDDVDLSFIQLVLSAKSSAAKAGLSLQVANLVSPAVLDGFVVAGLIPHKRITGRELDMAIDRFLNDQE